MEKDDISYLNELDSLWQMIQTVMEDLGVVVGTCYSKALSTIAVNVQQIDFVSA